VSYGKAMRIADQLAQRQPDFTRANLTRMAARESLGDIAALRDNIEASLKLYSEGEEIGERMARRDPHNWQALRLLSELYGASAWEDHNVPRAIPSARKCLAIRERLAAAAPNSEAAQVDLAEGHSVLSEVLQCANQFDEALVEARKNVRIYESLVAAHPLNATSRHDLMEIYDNLGDAASGFVSAANDLPRGSAEALDGYRKAVALGDTLLAAEPADRVVLEDRGMAELKLGATIPADKDLKSALTMLRRALADFKTVSEAQPGSVRVLRKLADTEMFIGLRLSMTGHTAEAVPSLRESIRTAGAVLGKNPQDRIALNYSRRAFQELAKVLASQGQRNEALSFARKAIAAGEAARASDGANPVTQSFLPRAWSNAGDVYETLASAPGAPATQRREDWLAARDAYQKSVDAWQRIPTQGAGPNNWDAQLTHARAEVKRCATAAAAVR
jgi:tetratricopeptide (TPR) repeat protein